MYNLIRKFPSYLLIIMALFVTAPLEANIKATTGQLSLMAMVDGKPAFRAVIWRLKPANPRQAGIRTVKRHAAIVDLEPGKYHISVSMGNKTRTRTITIAESRKHSLVVNLD